MTYCRTHAIPCAVALASALVALPTGQEHAQEVPPDVPALLAAGLYEQAEAAARDGLNRMRGSFGIDSLELATASDDLVRSLILNGRATEEATIALAKGTLEVKEARLGSSHHDLVPSLLNLSDVLAAAAELEPAIVVARRAVLLRETPGPWNSLDLAEALDHLGGAQSAARQYEQALEALERSLRLKEAALDSGNVTLVPTLEEIGLVLQRKGDYGASGAPLRRAAAIQQAARADHPTRARTLNLMAQQIWFEGNLIESRTVSERAVDLSLRTLRRDHPTVAQSLRYLASTLADLGDLERSLALKKTALDIAERCFGPTHPETALYLHSLAHTELREGEYSLARQRFRTALAIFEARYGRWHEHVATALSLLARADAILGDYANARREQARAVTIHERVGGPNHPYVANALIDLATVYREQGLPAEALRFLERALVIRERNLGPSHRDVARTLADMASTLALIGQTTRAQAASTRAVAIWERVNTPEAPDYASALALYARLQSNRGDDAAARDYYERALAIRGGIFGQDHPLFAETQAALAAVLARLGETRAAFSASASAEAAGRDHLRLMLRSLSERVSLNYAAARPRGLDLMLSLLGPVPNGAEAALDGLIQGRALVLDEVAVRNRMASTLDGVAGTLRTSYVSAGQRLANLMVRGPGPLTSGQYAALLDKARAAAEDAEQGLAEHSAEFRVERSRAQLGLGDVAAALSAGDALVSFVRYGRAPLPAATLPPAARSRKSSIRTVPSYMAFVLREGHHPVAVPLGTASLIDAAVSRWRHQVGGALPSRASGSELRRLAWDPIVPHIAAVERIFIVPEGSLSLVPFAALPTGSRGWLIEEAPVIHYLTAERDLVRIESKPAGNAQGLLAVGGAAFGRSTPGSTVPRLPPSTAIAAAQSDASAPATLRGAGRPCADLQSIRFQPLTGTLREVQELSTMWTQPVPSDGQAQLLTGRDATETRLKQQAPRHRVLHLATHGFFLGGDCSPAVAGTRGVGGLSRVSGELAPAENPLLLSGLALAGANRRAAAAPDEDDGILTAEEVASLDLSGVEWAVLSACDTGVGEIKAGEGVFGLRRAFQVAGARTVIMSLWSVEDQATRAWMRALYEARFQKRLSTADAVHAASLSMLQERRAKGQSTHPFFWAAFVAAGDWR